MTIPSFRAAGTYASSAGASVGMPAGLTAGDLLIIVAESGNQNINTPAGFNSLGSAIGNTGTAGTSNRIDVFWKIATGSETTTSIGGPSNHISAQSFAFSGVNQGSPIHAFNNTGLNTASTAVSIAGVTTTKNDCLIFNIVGWATDTATAQASSWANASLSSVTERSDASTTNGNGGGFATATGGLATAGATGSTTATLATSSAQGKWTIAIEAFQPLQYAVGTAAGSATAAAESPHTRFYFNGGYDFQALNTAADSLWDTTTNLGFFGANSPLRETKTNGGRLDVSFPGAPSTNNYDVPIRHYKSLPLAAQTISGNVKGQMQAYHSLAGTFPNHQVVMKVVSFDGSTVRGTLYSGSAGSAGVPPSYASTTAANAVNRKLPQNTTTSLTPVNAQHGDRLLIEIGSRQVASNGSTPTIGLIMGDVNGTDLPENETTTGAGDPWIEFNKEFEYVDVQYADSTSGTFTNVTNNTGGVDNPWFTPSNAATSNNTYTKPLNGFWTANQASDWLKVSNLGFSIPSNAMILGVSLILEHYRQASRVVQLDKMIMLKDITAFNFPGNPASRNAYAVQNLANDFVVDTTETVNELGGPYRPIINYDTNLPHSTPLTPADFNSSNFGLALTVYNNSGSSTEYNIDQLKLRVYYTVPPTSDERRDGVATAAATAAAVGKSLNKKAGASSAAATAAAVGRALVKRVGTSAGVATAAATSRIAFKAVGTAAGVASALAESFISGTTTGTATAAATAAAVGKSLARSVATTAATATAAATSRLLNSQAGVAAGQATAAAISITARKAVGLASAAATAVAAGLSLVKRTGAATAEAAAIGVGASQARASSSVAGVSTASATGESEARSTGVADGIADASAAGRAGKRSIGLASGIASIIGYLTGAVYSEGSAAGVSDAEAESITAMITTGEAEGVAEAEAVSNAIARSVGLAEGTATVTGRVRYNKILQVPHTVLTLKGGAKYISYEVIEFNGEPIPQSHIEDSHKLDADAYIELFQIILSDKQSKLYLKLNKTGTWGGNTYEGTGIKMDGVAKYADDQVARPKVTIYNPEGVYSYLVDQGLLDGAIIVRYRVLKEDYEADRPIYRRQQWKVSRVASVKTGYIALELRDMMDGQNFLTPARMFIPPDFPTVSLN